MGKNTEFFKRLDFYVYTLILVFAWVSLISHEIGVQSKDVVFMPMGEMPQPPSCPENEFFKYCMGNCTNCEQRGKCPIDCSKTGCDCRLNYVRLTPGGKCEPVSKCPRPKCGESEVYRPCGPVCERCTTLRCRLIGCEYRCYCKQGYLRNEDGECIAEDDCPLKLRCSHREEMRDSGPVDEYCLQSETEEVSSATVEKQQCYCRQGLKRNSMGHCTNETFCSYISCMFNQVYLKCPKKCNTTCRGYGDPDCKEDGQCYPGCFCSDGLLMNDIRRCVPLEECPPGSNAFVPTAVPTPEPSTTEETSSPSTTPSDTSTSNQDSTSGEGDTTKTTDEDDDIPDEEEEDVKEMSAASSTRKASTPTPVPKPLKKEPESIVVKSKTKGQSAQGEKEALPEKLKLASHSFDDENE